MRNRIEATVERASGQKTEIKPESPESITCGTANYFLSLFNVSESDHLGWSPPHTYPSGIMIFRQGDAANQVYLIEKGVVKLSYSGAGGEEMILGLHRGGELLGVTRLCDEENLYPATATTLTPCVIRDISAMTFMEQLSTDIRLSMALNRLLSRRIKEDTERIISLGSMSASERLKHFLCELITVEDRDNLSRRGKLQLPITGSELAKIIAVTPQHLYRLLKDPTLQQHLLKGQKMLTIVEPLKLCEE